jgi:hypothetical protein
MAGLMKRFFGWLRRPRRDDYTALLLADLGLKQ